MSREHDYFVYLLSNKTRTVLYIGITSDLEARMRDHISQRQPTCFTARYQVNRLMYYQQFDEAYVAIAREKQLKGWTRAKKEALIATRNLLWTDLSAGWEALRHVRDAILANG